jgi:uncharacterized RmlC-like cupin family protein
MSVQDTKDGSTTRREFVKIAALGAAGLAAAPAAATESVRVSSPQAGGKRYGKWIKPLSFEKWQGPYRHVSRHTSEFADLHVEYGTPAVAGRFGADAPEVHEYNQAVIFMGSDPMNIGELGAHVEFCIGPEREKHMITTSSAVFIPKGLAHMPATAVKMDRPFIVMTLSQTSAPQATPAPPAEKQYTGEPIAGLGLFGSKYRDNFPIMLWERKGPWHYGYQNQDDAEGYITSISGSKSLFNFHMMYEGINKAPYRFGDPYKPHVHNYDESLIFMGTDCDDLSKLPGEAVMCMGPEMEKHVITTPTLVHLPKGFPHCPTAITRADKPFIFIVLQAFGSGGLPKL